MSDALRAKGLNFWYGDLPVLDNIDIEVGLGEVVALLGPSGCGKSTLFHIIAGLLEAGSGSIEFPLHRDATLPPVGYMLQKDLLLPWLTLRANALLSATASPRSGRPDRVRAAGRRLDQLLPVFELADFVDYYPGQLSGGMRQRGALLRTCVGDPDILLLDEPLGALDAITRRRLQGWIRGVIQDLGISVLLVTHDVEEAVLLADRVLVLSGRPARIMKQIDVNLEGPRDGHQSANPQFQALALELLDALESA